MPSTMQLLPAQSTCLGAIYFLVQQGKLRRHCPCKEISLGPARLLTELAAQNCSKGSQSGWASGKLAVLHMTMLLEILECFALYKPAGKKVNVSVAHGRQVLLQLLDAKIHGRCSVEAGLAGGQVRRAPLLNEGLAISEAKLDQHAIACTKSMSMWLLSWRPTEPSKSADRLAIKHVLHPLVGSCSKQQ